MQNKYDTHQLQWTDVTNQYVIRKTKKVNITCWYGKHFSSINETKYSTESILDLDQEQ